MSLKSDPALILKGLKITMIHIDPKVIIKLMLSKRTGRVLTYQNIKGKIMIYRLTVN